MSQALFAATPEPKQLVLFPGASHNNLAEIAGPQYLQVIQRFLEQVQAQQQLVEKD